MQPHHTDNPPRIQDRAHRIAVTAVGITLTAIRDWFDGYDKIPVDLICRRVARVIRDDELPAIEQDLIAQYHRSD